MDRLDKGIGIGMLVQIIKGIQVHAVKTFGGMAFTDMEVFRGKAWTAGKGKRGSVNGDETVAWRCFISGEEGIKVSEDGFQSVRAEFVPLLVQGRWGRGGWIHVKKVKQFIFCGRGTL